MPLKRRYVMPDWARRGLRQGIGVSTAVCIGYLLLQPVAGLHPAVANQWLQGCKWAAITCVVVTAPVLGKVAQVSLERTIGTIIGGIVGFLIVSGADKMPKVPDVVVAALSAGLVGFGAAAVGWWLGLDYSAKLCVMTTILVVMGAEQGTDALLVAITRTSGIILGVILSLVLSVILFPKSASHQATDNMALALEALAKLCDLAWNRQTPTEHKPPLDRAVSERRRGRGTQYVRIPSSANDQSDQEWVREQIEEKEAECEQVLMDVYSKVNKCQEYIVLSQNENYVATIRGRWCFIPGISYVQCSRWKLPQQEMADLATAARKVARVLWALHVTFQQGFEEDIMAAVRRRYPSNMMANLQRFSQEAIEDLVDAFPLANVPASDNLHQYLQAVHQLIKASDAQRTRTMQFMQELTARSRTNSFVGLSPVMSPLSTPPGPLLEAAMEQQPSSAASLPEVPVQQQPEQGPQLNGSSPSEGSAGAQHTQYANGDVPAAEQQAWQANGGFKVETKQQPAAVAGQPAQVQHLFEQLQQVHEEGGPPTPTWRGRTSRDQAPPPPAGAAVQHFERSRTLQSLPSLRMEHVSEGDEDGFPVTSSEIVPGLMPQHLDAFPASTKGYVSKVRWYSFQFLMQQLADELQDAHVALGNVLAGLPAEGRHGQPQDEYVL